VYPSRGFTSGLSVLEIDIPTGYVIMNDTLRDYVRSGVVQNLRRAEFYGRKVVFYFSYVSGSSRNIMSIVFCVSIKHDHLYMGGKDLSVET
jgi:hypothetical protein